MSDGSVRRRISKWALLEGNRLAVAGVIAAGITVCIYSLAVAGLIALGPSSNVRTLLSSGLASGLLTLITITLSINQLLLSRVFGPPEEFVKRLSGSSDFRSRAAKAANQPLPQNDPKKFLLAVVRALRERAGRFDDELPADVPDELASYGDDVGGYADRIADALENDSGGTSNTTGVMTAILGPEYARYLTEGSRLRDEYGTEMSQNARVELEGVFELLKSVAVFRQFLKTLAVQQDLAKLSRYIAYSGIVGLVTTFVLALTYRAGSGAALPAGWLPPVTSVGLGIISLPLALLISYIVRIATISLYTVSAGTFIPPKETFQE